MKIWKPYTVNYITRTVGFQRVPASTWIEARCALEARALIARRFDTVSVTSVVKGYVN